MSDVSAGLKDLFPLGDLDDSVVGAVAGRFPAIHAAAVAAALRLLRSILGLLEEVPRPIFDAGLSPARWRLLIALVGQAGEEGARIGELAEHLGVREPTITATVDRAESDGLVRRARDAHDGRIVRVTLTPEGIATVASLLPTVSQRMSELVAGLGGPEATRVMADRLDGAVATATVHSG